MSKKIRCQVPSCEDSFKSKSGYLSHLRAHIRDGDITVKEYEELKEKTGKKVVLPESEVRILKAEARKYKRIANRRLKGLDFLDRVTRTIRDSLESVPTVEAPKISLDGGAEKDEVPVLLLGDTHIGKKTPTYDHEIFKVRLRRLMEGVQSIIGIQRHVRPLKKIVVVMLGDMIDAESIYPSQAVEGVSVHILDQIYAHGVPALKEFLLFLLGLFEEVEIHAVRGNHGRLYPSKWTSAKSTNWDLVFYKSLETALEDQDRIDWNIYDGINEWKAIFKIFDYGFLATHGDMIRMYYNMPDYGISRQSTRWQATYRDELDLHYFLFGHFHTLVLRKRFNQVVYSVNGSFITDDEHAERTLGIGPVPEQALFGVHPEWGFTWGYSIRLDKDGKVVSL